MPTSCSSCARPSDIGHRTPHAPWTGQLAHGIGPDDHAGKRGRGTHVPMSQISANLLLDTQTATIRDVVCRGECRHRSAEECADRTHLVFPYRGVYVRHTEGHDDAVAEANQVLFFHAAESYRVSHPVVGGDASLDVVIDEPLLRELVRSEERRVG